MSTTNRYDVCIDLPKKIKNPRKFLEESLEDCKVITYYQIKSLTQMNKYLLEVKKNRNPRLQTVDKETNEKRFAEGKTIVKKIVRLKWRCPHCGIINKVEKEENVVICDCCKKAYEAKYKETVKV